MKDVFLDKQKMHLIREMIDNEWWINYLDPFPFILLPPSFSFLREEEEEELVWYGMIWYGSLVGTTNDFDEASYHIDPDPDPDPDPYITLLLSIQGVHSFIHSSIQ